MLTFHLTQNHGGWNSDDNQNNNLGRFRLSRHRRPPTPRPIRCRRRSARSSPCRASSASPAQTAAVFSYWRTTVPEWKEANDRDRGAVAAASARARRSWRCSRATSIAQTLVLDARRLPQADEAGAAGRAGVPAPAARRTRRRPADVRPLAGRSPSRRRRPGRSSIASGRRTSAPAWSRTSEDFGTAGRAAVASRSCSTGWPSSSWSSGWSLKQLHRLIVTSATYRQSSRVTPELLARDPDNRLLARGPRFRVEAEVVRDIALAASGLLEPQARRAAASIRRRPTSCSCRRPATARRSGRKSTGPDRYRRALYTFRFRSVPYPVLQTFDAPNGDFSCVRRVRSRTRRCRR